MELSIVTFNSASLVSHAKRATAQVLIDSLKADIYCVSETHLKSRHNVNFTGYNTIRDDNNTGSALLIKKDYEFEEVAIDNLLTCSAAAAFIKTAGNKRILIVSVYIRCQSRNEELGHDLKVLSDLQLKSNYLVFGGDFNSRHTHWGDTAINCNGKTLLKWIHAPFSPTNLVMILPNSPLRPSSQSIILPSVYGNEAKLSGNIM